VGSAVGRIGGTSTVGLGGTAVGVLLGVYVGGSVGKGVSLGTSV